MSGAGSLNAINPPAHETVRLGEGPEAIDVVVRPLVLGKLPAFARALGPLSEQLEVLLREGLSARGLMGLVENHLPNALEALEVATDVPKAKLEQLTIDQALELVLSVMTANRNFFKGRMATALRMAAAVSGSGRTASRPSSAPAGRSPKSKSSLSTS